ncbi:unnamed protein product [Orchesella dallaii]|uniref:Deoxyhypusine hydroxylase n=1 Tax=Orchesella dallaii TaxID=48710 RepID=A0ABP1RXA5_9HEXA
MKPTIEPPKASDDQVIKLGEYLRDPEKPLKGRFRALFTLRNIKNELSIKQIGECFSDTSALLKHELAYCLGQMQSSEAIPILSNVLGNKAEHPMVRHEAAEALGAIGTEECLTILKDYVKDDEEVVRETVELALGRIKEVKDNNISDPTSPYLSVDPAFPMACKDVKKLEETLLDENLPLYQRYQAMFSLRDLNTSESIQALCKGFQGKSALFRHEIAFVLGQIQHPDSIAALTKNLGDLDENEMVRHECAEALGAIGNPECEKILKVYLEDQQRVVRESCVVALDICDYEMAGNFQYADGLQTIATESS